MPRCGIVALAGAPNVGKSSLLNALIGERLAIVSPKPQTTREPVRGLLTEGDTQILFVDPAGLLVPGYPLQRAMVRAAVQALNDADLVLQLHPLSEAPAPAWGRVVQELKAEQLKVTAERVLVVYTKADLGRRGERGEGEEGGEGGEPGAGEMVVSAVTGQGISELLAAVRARLPESPFLYDTDDVGTQPLRFFAAEFVREAAYAELEQELPYSIAVEIDEFRESRTPVYIRATLAVERPSQKPIVLGQGGRTIKAIGTRARARLEALLKRRVHLALWVAVWPKWRRHPATLARLGLPLPTEPSR